jgi:hypothetical protein
LPGALELVGRYRVSKEMVQVNVTIFKGEKEIVKLTVEGSSKDLDLLAATIVQRVEQWLDKQAGR